MTAVTLFKDRTGCLCGFRADGHAGYARAGQDIVCAAVSSLTTTCVNALESVAGVMPRVRMADGVMEATLSPDDCTHDAQIILKVLEQGLKDLQESYPKYIRLTIEG